MFGRIPYGYRREYDQDPGELLRQVPDEATAPYVVEIIERVAAGHGIDRIVRDLAARTVPDPRGKGWSRATVRWIATNPVYIARRSHKGEIVGAGNWPPLIRDEAKFWAATAILKNPARRTHRGNEPAYLLTGIPVCGRPVGDPPEEGDEPPRCGGRFYRSASRGGEGRPKRQQYTCVVCRKASISMPILDTYVQAALLEWLEVPGRAEQVMKALGADSMSDTLAEITRLEAQLAEARALAAQLRLTPAGLAAAEAGLLPAVSAARSRLLAAVPNPALARLLDGDPRARWGDMKDVEDRRSAIKATAAVEVRPVGAGKRSPRWLPDRVKIRWILGA